jgi:hypothetical protein
MLEQIGMALLGFLVITLIIRFLVHVFNFAFEIIKKALVLLPAAVCVVCWLTGNLLLGILSVIAVGLFYFFYSKYKRS